MPPCFKFSKEQLINAAFELVRISGLDSLTARKLATELGSSSKVIFGMFNSMDELKEEVILKANSTLQERILVALSSVDVPSYLTCAMAYINFAKTEKELFKALFLRNNRTMQKPIKDEYLVDIYKVISLKSGVSLEEAKEIHFKYWLFVHGVAVLLINKVLELDDDYIRNLLKENYLNLVRSAKENRG